MRLAHPVKALSGSEISGIGGTEPSNTGPRFVAMGLRTNGRGQVPLSAIVKSDLIVVESSGINFSRTVYPTRFPRFSVTGVVENPIWRFVLSPN